MKNHCVNPKELGTSEKDANNQDDKFVYGTEKEDSCMITDEVHNSKYSPTDGDAVNDEETVTEEVHLIVPPDGGWGWFCVLGATVIHLLIGGLERASGLIYIQLVDMFQDTASNTAWALSLGSVIRLLLGPVSSSLANRFSCRSVVIAGGVITSLGIGLSVFATSLWQMYITLGILRGIGWSFAYTPSLIIVHQYFNKKRGLAIGLAVAGVGMGTFCLPPLVELMFEHYGFRGTILMLAGLQLNICVCGALFRPPQFWKRSTPSNECKKHLGGEHSNINATKSHPRKSNAIKEQLSNEETLGTDEESKVKTALLMEDGKSVKNRKGISFLKILKINKKPSGENRKTVLDISLLKNIHFLLFGTTTGLFTVAFMSFNVFTPDLVKSKGVTELEAAYMLSILGVTDTFGRIVITIILDFKNVKYYRLLIFGSILFLFALVLFILPALNGFYMFAITGGFYGALSGAYIGQKSVALVDILGVEKVSSAFGLLICFQGIGTLVGPPFSGFLKDSTESYEQTYYFLGGVVLLGAVIMSTANLAFVYCKDCKSRKRRSV